MHQGSMKSPTNATNAVNEMSETRSSSPTNARALFGAVLSMATLTVQAVQVQFEAVAEGVYAHVVDTGPRTMENEGLNANIGLVVTPAGALLIDSGATFQSARQIHAAVAAVTSQPVKWVFNTGGQDHRWLGNGYFADQGTAV